jgi:predicted acyl esterase
LVIEDYVKVVIMTEECGMLGILVDKDAPVLMRDGVILRANVFRPDASGKFPGLLVRTPYEKAQEGFTRYVRSGYVIISQDSRGSARAL